jgi:hypothetical protein
MRGKVGRSWLLLHLGEADEVWVDPSESALGALAWLKLPSRTLRPSEPQN